MSRGQKRYRISACTGKDGMDAHWAPAPRRREGPVMTRTSTMRLRGVTITCAQRRAITGGPWSVAQVAAHFGIEDHQAALMSCGCFYLWCRDAALPAGLGRLLLEELQLRAALAKRMRGVDAPPVVPPVVH